MLRIKHRLVLPVILFYLTGFSYHLPPKKYTPNSCDSVYVSKTKKRMSLYSGKQFIRSFDISIGMNAIGHKKQQGDNKTPEGIYYINDKNCHSAYYKNLGISYPNQQDRERAKKQHVKAGGDIKIHGYADEYGRTKSRSTRYAYTWGCLALTNEDMDMVFDLVKVGAVILIEP